MDTNQSSMIRNHPFSVHQLNRRSFLLAGSAFAAGAATSLDASEPISRQDHKFKLSLAAYSYRSLLSGKDATMSLFDFADDCAKFGLEGTELTSYYFPEDFDSTYLHKLRRHCFLQGLDISGTAIRNDFGFEAGEQRQKEMEHVKSWIRYAQQLGAPVIRVFAGHQKPGLSDEQTHRLIVSGLEECCDYAGKHGIHLALENHGGPTATASGLLGLVRDVKSDWFGVNLDTGNFRTNDVYGDIEKVVPFALNVQVKVVIKEVNGTKKETDYSRLATILRQANYRGYVVLEYEEAGDVRAKSKAHLHKLRDALLG